MYDPILEVLLTLELLVICVYIGPCCDAVTPIDYGNDHALNDFEQD